MDHEEIAGLVSALAPVVADFTIKAMAPLRAENVRLSGCIEALEKRFSEIPSREDHSVLILRLVEETVSKLPPAPAGKDGTDADPTLIAELVDKAVSALEPAKDGKDADPAAIAVLLIPEVKKAVAQLPKAENGKDGTSFSADDVRPILAEMVLTAVSAIPTPENGKDGASVSIDDIAPLVAEEVSKVVAAIPNPENGKDGEPGKSVDESVVLAMIDQKLRIQIPFAVEDEVAKIRPQDGRDGRDGLPGLQGEKGIDGRDGVDGRDGFAIDDFDVKTENEGRTLVFSLTQAERDPIVKQVDTSLVLDRGVWREQAYEKGDGVTWGGSFFIAQRSTVETDKPGTTDGWRLSIKKGRDGKDGLPGKAGDRGPEGKAGRDMTQRAF